MILCLFQLLTCGNFSSLKMRECHSCQSYQEQLELEQNKLSQLEKQMKKCGKNLFLWPFEM